MIHFSFLLVLNSSFYRSSLFFILFFIVGSPWMFLSLLCLSVFGWGVTFFVSLGIEFLFLVSFWSGCHCFFFCVFEVESSFFVSIFFFSVMLFRVILCPFSSPLDFRGSSHFLFSFCSFLFLPEQQIARIIFSSF